MVLFLGSDADLPTSGWSEDEPACYVGGLEWYQEPVRQHFSKRHVRYLGSHLQCGCGFGFEYDDTEGEEPENAGSRRWLVELLRSLVDGEGEVEVYSCWNGTEGEEVAERVRARPEDFADVRAVGEGTFAVVSRDAALPASTPRPHARPARSRRHRRSLPPVVPSRRVRRVKYDP